MQLVGLRYTEPDMTISYPGFLYLLMKLENMICKRGRRGRGLNGEELDALNCVNARINQSNQTSTTPTCSLPPNMESAFIVKSMFEVEGKAGNVNPKQEYFQGYLSKRLCN